MIDVICYVVVNKDTEATKDSQAKQEDVDKFAREVNKQWGRK